VDLMITAIALEFADAVSTRDRAHFNFSGIVVAS
jgi:predicted nucleic acid-binding protein